MNYGELLKKYNIPGPRYTSYPTVPYWHANPTEEQWVESLSNSVRQSEQSQTGAAVYVHIPFCESLCTYCGCNTRITRNHAVETPYVETVLKEWQLYFDKMSMTSSRMLLSELHLGGGTPTFLKPAMLAQLMEGILSHCKLSEAREFSIEADPRVTSIEHLKVLREFGFTRLSLGIQDFDHKVQDIVHRIQSPEQVRKIVESARELGFTSINFDLIYGLPLQTRKSIEDTMRIVQDMRPDRIAFYSYAHVPWIKPGQRRFTENDLPDGNEKRALYELGRMMLEEVGYREIGMDHFALETDSLWKASAETKTLHRNFMGYTARNVAPLFGLGVSAIGDSWNIFAQNEKLLEVYQEKVHNGILPIYRGHVLSAEDLILRQHILNLMTQFETSWHSEQYFTPFLKDVPAKLVELERDGLITLGADTCSITPEGRAFLRNVCMAFDARLSAKAPDAQLFSKTI